jgi:hypothetical protein
MLATQIGNTDIINISQINLNNIKTTNEYILHSETMQEFAKDICLVENSNINLENDLFDTKSIQLFFSFADRIFKNDEVNIKITSLLPDLNLLTAVRLCNYFGCPKITKTLKRICGKYFPENEPPTIKFICHKELNISLQGIKYLTEKDYRILITMGYHDKDILPYVNEHELLPIQVNDDFNIILDEHKSIIDLVNEVDNCFIAGGFLIHCMQSMINSPHKEFGKNNYDIDIWCMSVPEDILTGHSTVATTLIEKFREKFDCKCFTNSAVTTIFLRNSPIQIQVICCADRKIEHIISSFDLICCKLAYIKEKGHAAEVLATVDFHNMMYNDWSFSVNGTIKYYRIEKYRKRGFMINTDKAQIVGYESYIKFEENKWYQWTDENEETLLRIVKTSFHKEYELTKLPLPEVKLEWRSVYDPDIVENFVNKNYTDDLKHFCEFPEVNKNGCIGLNFETHMIHLITKIIHVPTLKPIILYDVKAKLKITKYNDKEWYYIIIDDNYTGKLDIIRKQLKNDEYNITDICELIENNKHKHKIRKPYASDLNDDIKVDISIKESIIWRHLVDLQFHNCNLKLIPAANIISGIIYVGVLCIDIELLS